MEKDNTRKIVLLVDDDEMHLSITELVLKEHYEIYTVSSGKDALEFLTKKKIIPDIILLDILMPEMDGWTVFDKINDISALNLTPILFYTSLEEKEAEAKAYEMGAFDFITKPCEQADLLNRIELAIQKAELRKKQQGI